MKKRKNEGLVLRSPLQTKAYRRYIAAVIASLAILVSSVALADTVSNDATRVIDNLSSFIFAVIRAIGLILLGFGIVQLGLSLKSHDPSQRANSFLTIAGGIIITFAKEILDAITG